MAAPSSSDTRVLIAYTPSLSEACADLTGLEGKLLHLRNPKTGANMCCMILDGALQEIHWFKERFASWFIGDSVCEDGSLYFATPLDPLLIVLPILEKARMKKGDDPGKLRALEEMMLVEGYSGYLHLAALLPELLDTICEVRESGKTSYYRLDDLKVLAWLSCKVQRISDSLGNLEPSSFSGMNEKDMSCVSCFLLNESSNPVLRLAEAYAVGLLGEYLTASWLSLLCESLSVDLDFSKRGRIVEPEPTASEVVLKGVISSKPNEKSGTSKRTPHRGIGR